MKREPLRLVFWLTLLVCLVSGRRARAGSIQELAASAKSSVVLLTISDASGRKVASGTGFFVSADGKIVTNHHVIADAVKVTASLSDGRKVDCQGVLADDEEKDLAIVKVPGDGYPPLVLGDSKSLRPGDEILVIGSPMGLSGTLSAGIVSALRDDKALDDDEDDRPGKSDAHTKSWGIQVTAAISPGSSGSPILTPGGEVVAVAVGAVTGGQALNFGIRIEEAKALLGRVSAAPKPFATGARSEVRKNLLISAAFFGALALFYFAFKRYETYRRRAVRAAVRKGPPS